MKIHEFQAKKLLRDAGIAVPRGIVATSPDQAGAAFSELSGSFAVVKAQIHAGGRGKGTTIEHPDQRGVQLVKSAAEAKTVAENLLGKRLVTIQTGPEGKTINQVLVEEGCDIARELYLGIVLDRAAAMPVLMMSSEGGSRSKRSRRRLPRRYSRNTSIRTLVCKASKFANSARSWGFPERPFAALTNSSARCASCTSISIAVWSKSTRWL